MLTKLLRRAAPFALILGTLAGCAQKGMPGPAPVAQSQDNADPALWVVKDDDTTIYLFGTVHVLKPGLSWFDEAVKKAFDASGELVLELPGTPDPAAIQPIIMKYGISTSGPTLTQKLPEDKRAPFAKAMAEFGVPQAAVDRFKPWLAGTQLSMLTLVKAGYDPKSGAEETLSAAAKAAGKPISGLETVEEQFGFLDSLPEPAQMRMLIDAIDKLDTAAGEFDKLVAAWSKGDAETLGALMNEGLRSTPELSKVLLADRNARWADWIKTRLDKPGVVFVAVGAGHLAGGDSVQAMLKARQVETKRVKY